MSWKACDSHCQTLKGEGGELRCCQQSPQRPTGPPPLLDADQLSAVGTATKCTPPPHSWLGLHPPTHPNLHTHPPPPVQDADQLEPGGFYLDRKPQVGVGWVGGGWLAGRSGR